MRLDLLRARLEPLPRHLPPPPRQLTPVVVGAPDGRPPATPGFPDPARRRAAVLILFHADEQGDAMLTLTERSAGGHRHAGQISLPGGAIDESDASVVAAALREASEEVGLDTGQAGVRVIGALPAVDVPVSGFLVHPVIAFAERPPVLTPDGYEVAEIISAPMAAFLPGAPIEIVTAERDGYLFRYGGYRIGVHHVWGATAFLLARLGAFVGQRDQADLTTARPLTNRIRRD